jgi:hypothetical protein
MKTRIVLITAAVFAAAVAVGVTTAKPAEAKVTHSWTVAQTPALAQGGNLGGISCPSVTSCVAVGDQQVGPNDYASLIESYSGGVWSVVPSPNPGDTSCSILAPYPCSGAINDLNDVSCASSTSCVAVGWYDSNGYDNCCSTLIETLHGGVWTAVPTSNPSGGATAGLSGVACTSATSCVAVGSTGSSTLIETLSRGTWTTTAAPSPSSSSYLEGISCYSRSACVAVGGTYNDKTNVGRYLIETLAGSTWAVTRSQNAGTTGGYPAFGDVSCKNASSCVAVGDTGSRVPVIDTRTNGVWTITPNPSTSGLLNGVWCHAETSCVAVGRSTSNSLIEGFAHSTWAIMPDPEDPADAGLSHVECSATTSCVAVGDYFSYPNDYPLIEIYR